jgi:hypothetical protein
MLNHVSNGSDLYANANIKNQQEVLGIDKRLAQKNPYSKVDGFSDQSEISELAQKLFEKDKDIQKFTKLLANDVEECTNTNELFGLLESGDYMNSDELADSLLNNRDFIDMFSSNTL